MDKDWRRFFQSKVARASMVAVFALGIFAVYMERSLMPWQQERITGRAGPNSSGTVLLGAFYNGNTKIHVTAVDITIRASDQASAPRTYRASVNIPPLSSQRFDLQLAQLPPDADPIWSISGARGKRKFP
jgi:hypothetical protein